MKPFKDKKFRHRTNLICVLFVILALSILILIQTQESHQTTLSLVVTLISGIILAIDMILSVYILLAEIYTSLKKRKLKNKRAKKIESQETIFNEENKAAKIEKSSSRVILKQGKTLKLDKVDRSVSMKRSKIKNKVKYKVNHKLTINHSSMIKKDAYKKSKYTSMSRIKSIRKIKFAQKKNRSLNPE
jgi:heme/copper-type cytochrome/quinol oxidase subunit 1